MDRQSTLPTSGQAVFPWTDPTSSNVSGFVSWAEKLKDTHPLTNAMKPKDSPIRSVILFFCQLFHVLAPKRNMQFEPTDPITPSQDVLKTNPDSLLSLDTISSPRERLAALRLGTSPSSEHNVECSMNSFSIIFLCFGSQGESRETLRSKSASSPAKPPQFCFNGVVVDCPTVT